ncbi:MAG TPA: hypothetical protein VHL13_01240, partial [Pseudolabrys sp.]|nr:hypothetical protein [Pseudolabrys sp.]
MTGLEALVKDAEVTTAKAPPAPLPAADDIDDIPLYAPRRKIYPQSVKGFFRRIKWAVLIATLGVYYFLPFIRWDRGP